MENGNPLIPPVQRKPRALTLDLTGKRVNYLTAVRPAGAAKGKKLWLVRCDCGVEKVLPGTEFTKGKIQSCGCKLKELISAKNKTHGMTNHPAYAVWRSMLDRCRLPTHHAYANYGGRGITVCKEWEDFSAFWKDMGASYKKGLTLDRIDNNRGYSRDNCRWANRVVQGNNRRSNVLIDTPKGRMTIAQAAEVFGIGKTTLCYRIANNWPEDTLFIKPSRANRVNND